MGSGMFASVSFILLIAVTRQYGVAAAAASGVSVTTSQILFRVGIFAVRQYQITDSEEAYRFSDYGSAKLFSTLLCFILFCGYAFLEKRFSFFSAEFLFVFLFYQLLSVDDLYQNRFFQKGRLDLSGKSRCAVTGSFLLSFICLTIMDIRLKTVCSVSFTAACICSYLFCFRKEKLLISRSSCINGRRILIMCLPAFVSNFLLSIVNCMPRYAAFYLCTGEESGYINDIFVLLNIVELIGTFIYYPFVSDITVTMKKDKKKAKKLVFSICTSVTVIAVIAAVGFFAAGNELLSVIYGIDFSSYRFEIVYTVGLCGLFVAFISLLYWIPIILRDQKTVVLVFVSGFLISLIGSVAGHLAYGVPGIIVGYSLGIGTIAASLIIYFTKKVNEGC